jgi:hypothetical protein
MRSLPRLACALPLSLLIAACGGGGGGGGGGDGDGGTGGPDADVGDGNLTLQPPPDGQGFQIIDNGAVIDPGQDIEYCEVGQLPGTPSDTYYVNKFESQMSTGSHHLIVSAIKPGSETDANTQVGDRTTCFGPGNAFTGSGGDLEEVTGQQLPDHSETFPAGVGRVYTGGQKVIFDFHYLNATDAPLRARAAVNFYTTTQDQIQHLAASAGFFFVGIDVPAGQTASYDVACAFDTDVMVYKLTRHTHRWGGDFPVWDWDGATKGDLIYTSPNYEDPDYLYDAPVAVPSGHGFAFQCNYDNTDGDHTLTFGPKTSNEMCILFPAIYSATAYDAPSQGCLKTN